MRRVLVGILLLAGCAGDGIVPGDVDVVTTSGGGAATSIPPAPQTPVCDAFAAPAATGPVGSADLIEISGIAASRSHPGILWVHNDSGGAPQMWALDRGGSVVGVIPVENAAATDWEDVAVGPGPDGDHLYVGDIGDNGAARPEVAIYRFPEPHPDAGRPAIAEALRVTYPGGSANAEALLVDPATGDVFIITKRLGGPGLVFRVPAAAWETSETTAEFAGELGLGLEALAGGPVTAADASPDGRLLAVRTYGDVWLWSRSPEVPIATALSDEPCRAPAPPEPFGEALALDDGGYWTVAEGEGATVWRVAGR